MYTKGCDTIYRVFKDVMETLSKTRRWTVHQRAETLTGARGRSMERGFVRINANFIT